MVFEDAPAGIRAGKAAGMTVIAFPTTYPLDALSEADCVAESLGSVHVESSCIRRTRVERDHPASLATALKLGERGHLLTSAANPT